MIVLVDPSLVSSRLNVDGPLRHIDAFKRLRHNGLCASIVLKAKEPAPSLVGLGFAKYPDAARQRIALAVEAAVASSTTIMGPMHIGSDEIPNAQSSLAGHDLAGYAGLGKRHVSVSC